MIILSRDLMVLLIMQTVQPILNEWFGAANTNSFIFLLTPLCHILFLKSQVLVLFQQLGRRNYLRKIMFENFLGQGMNTQKKDEFSVANQFTLFSSKIILLFSLWQ